MRTIDIPALEFDTADEAIQEVSAGGCGRAIRIQGKTLVVTEETADRLERTGVAFGYLSDHRGRIVTVPVN